VCAWRLDRQRLTDRLPKERMLDAARELCGVHAQVMSCAEIALANRVDGLRVQDVRRAVAEDRSLVKTWGMRGTLHLFTADDLPLYVAGLKARAQHYSPQALEILQITDEDVEVTVDAIHRALDGRQLLREELAEEVLRITGREKMRDVVLSGWGSLPKIAALRGYLCFGPNQGRNVTFVRPEQWLGSWREVGEHEAYRELLRRYLAAHGPSSVDDLARWWGVSTPEMRSRLKLLDGELQSVEIEGYRAFALSDSVAAMKDASSRGSARLLPGFDAYTVLVGRQIDRLMPGPYKSRIYRKSAWITPALVLDGRFIGIWSHEVRKKVLQVSVEPWVSLSGKVKRGIKKEAERIGEFLGYESGVAYA
jgi:hypothetical protein